MKVQLALLVALLAVHSSIAVPGGGGKGKGGGGGGGGYGGGYHARPYVAHKSVVEYRPVTVHQPVIVKKPILVRPPPPPPKLVHKPVVHHVQEWRLVSVPKVSYQPVYVQPIPNYGGGGGKGKGGKLFGGKGKGGGGW